MLGCRLLYLRCDSRTMRCRRFGSGKTCSFCNISSYSRLGSFLLLSLKVLGCRGEWGVLATFSFRPDGVFSLDEFVVETHPCVEVIHVHVEFAPTEYIESILVMLSYVAQYAPMVLFEQRPVTPHIVSGKAWHVGVARECIADGRDDYVCKILIEHGCGEFLEFCFSHCSAPFCLLRLVFRRLQS